MRGSHIEAGLMAATDTRQENEVTEGNALTRVEEIEGLEGLAQLDGGSGGGSELRSLAGRYSDQLLGLAPEERRLWVTVAAELFPRNLRDKRSVLVDLMEALSPVKEDPGVRPVVHRAIVRLADRSVRLMEAYAQMLRSLVGRVETQEIENITELGMELTTDVDLGSTFFRRAPRVLARRDREFLEEWHRKAQGLAGTHWWAARGYLEAVSEAAHWLGIEDLEPVAEMGRLVAERSRHAAKSLYSALPGLLGSMTVDQLRDWVNLGLEVAEKEDELVLYMSYGSRRSREAVDLLCRETSFATHKPRVALLLEAFTGHAVRVRGMREVLDPVHIPPDVPAFSDRGVLYVRSALSCRGLPPISLYKLVALHAVAHERFDSFAHSGMARLLGQRAQRAADESSVVVELFLVGACEDYRVDEQLFRVLPGLRQDAGQVVRMTYAEYDSDETGGVGPTPSSLRAHLVAARFGISVLRREDSFTAEVEEAVAPLREEGSTVEDSLVAARRLFSLVEPLWVDGVDDAGMQTLLEAADVPYPPYHDHFFLGLQLASNGDNGSAAQSAQDQTQEEGRSETLDIPSSLHPSEMGEGLMLAFQEDENGEHATAVLEDDGEENGSGFDGDVFTYDEWDYEVGDYRSEWCTVRCQVHPEGSAKFVRDTLAKHRGEVLLIRRQFERLRPERLRRYFRQREGDELDIDALTEALVDRAAGAPMDDKVYVRRDKKERDVAVLFLLDMSDSTDQPVTADRRVIDVEKEGLVLLSEAIEQLGDSFSIVGFSSQGRKCVDTYVTKDFGEPWGDDVARRIAGVEPKEYTRLGAALRHATDHVRAQEADTRLIVLLSDGRPYDMGYGDMRYAMEDTKNALLEARRAGIEVFCITVDPEGPDYLEEIFGRYQYTVIQNVEALPMRLPRIYRNLTV